MINFNQKMSIAPKVSIITVAFNEEKDILKTCRSVSNQTYKNFEWIVVDGKSTDKTIDIVKRFSNTYKILVSESDNGIYDAMNKGISLAKGEYLLFLNGGDYLYDRKVLEEVFLEGNYKGDVLYGNCCVLRSDGTKQILDFAKTIDKYYLINTCINHQSTFIKRELFNVYDLYDTSYQILGDYEKWLKFITNGCSYVKIPIIISCFKFYDGKSSNDKYLQLNNQEKMRAISKYFTKLDLVIYSIKIGIFNFKNVIRRMYQKITR